MRCNQLRVGLCSKWHCVLQAMSIQYHPEASPGPHDSDICFDQFIAMLEAERDGTSADPLDVPRLEPTMK